MGDLVDLARSLARKLTAALRATGIPTAAVEANERANREAEAGDGAAAERGYLEAARLAPGWSSPWFNLGILWKRQGRWEDARRACLRTLALDPESEGARWNLAIACTALADWTEARRAWRTYGVEVPDGEGPIEMDLGPVPVRVDPARAPEVVWCRRIDPARAVVVSVPTPDCGRRHGDLLLHDGAPNGWRKLGDREVAVFDELALLAPSRRSTFLLEADLPGPEDWDALESALSARGAVAEDWTVQVEMLCKACSEGRPHADGDAHREAEAPGWTARHRVGIAAEDEAPVLEALREWARGGPGRAHGALERALEGVARS